MVPVPGIVTTIERMLRDTITNPVGPEFRLALAASTRASTSPGVRCSLKVAILGLGSGTVQPDQTGNEGHVVLAFGGGAPDRLGEPLIVRGTIEPKVILSTWSGPRPRQAQASVQLVVAKCGLTGSSRLGSTVSQVRPK
jgi:hypothetical protein